MRSFFNLFISFIFLISGCTSSRLLSKANSNGCTIKFFIERNEKSPEVVDKIYALVDSAGTQSYVSFYPDKILKVNGSENLIFTAVARNNTGVWGFQPLTTLDSIVMKMAAHHQDALSLQWLRLNSVLGYQAEVNYYHGRPKNYKLKPL